MSRLNIAGWCNGAMEALGLPMDHDTALRAKTWISLDSLAGGTVYAFGDEAPQSCTS